jgi:plastocyanin
MVVLPADPAEATTHAVTIKQYAYGSGSLNIKQGDTVSWTNRDGVQHDVLVTDGPGHFRSPLLSKGQSWSHTFATAGTYSYTCSLHPDMRGSVKVNAKAAAQPKPSAKPTDDQQDETAAGADTKKKDTDSAEPSATPTAVPASTAVAPAAQQTASLNPFLLLLGAATGVVVFCLLLMASRPQAQPAIASTRPSEDQSG